MAFLAWNLRAHSSDSLRGIQGKGLLRLTDFHNAHYIVKFYILTFQKGFGNTFDTCSGQPALSAGVGLACITFQYLSSTFLLQYPNNFLKGMYCFFFSLWHLIHVYNVLDHIPLPSNVLATPLFSLGFSENCSHSILTSLKNYKFFLWKKTIGLSF